VKRQRRKGVIATGNFSNRNWGANFKRKVRAHTSINQAGIKNLTDTRIPSTNGLTASSCLRTTIQTPSLYGLPRDTRMSKIRQGTLFMEHPIVLGKLRERLANRSMNMTLW
jgi:hypothetical protein